MMLGEEILSIEVIVNSLVARDVWFKSGLHERDITAIEAQL